MIENEKNVFLKKIRKIIRALVSIISKFALLFSSLPTYKRVKKSTFGKGFITISRGPIDFWYVGWQFVTCMFL